MNVAVILGGTGGICRYIAALIAEEKETDEVWVLTRSAERARSIFPSDSKIKIIETDFDEPDVLLSKALLDGEHNVKWLVNGIGVGLIADAADTPSSDAENMIRANCLIMTKVTPAIIPFMQRGAHIMNLASAASFCPQPHFSVYAASKAYALSYSRALGAELKNRGITVTAVCPGPVNTDFIGRAERDRKISQKKKRAMAHPKAVASHAYKYAKRGKPLCVYSLKMKLSALACKLLPTGLVMKFFG